MPFANRLLIQVVAQLKPERCGLSDYAISLATELESAFGIGTAFVVLNSTKQWESPFPAIYCTQSQLLESCDSLTKGQPGTLLVHLSGFGFSKDGAPLALAESLAKVKESGRYRIAVYFHELYVNGAPWKRYFWYQRRQKRALRMIARESGLIATNLNLHADWLQRQVGQGAATPPVRLPVFSNVGETLAIPPISARRPSMVVFGLPGTRKRSYSRLSSLGSTLHSLGVDEILDIGPECDTPSSQCEIPVKRMGVLVADEVHSILLNSRFGFVPHPSHTLAKSGVFAALSALGTIPVLGKPFAGEVDGLRDGVHLISSRTVAAALKSGLQSCSTAAWRWYSDHRLHVHAANYARLFLPFSTEAEADISTGARSSEEHIGLA